MEYRFRGACNDPRPSPMKTVPIAILLGGIIVAGAVYLSVHSHEPSTASSTGNPALVRPVGAFDHVLGNPNAPVKIIEYSDFDCSYCKGYNDVLHQIVADLGAGGKVAWVYREFPITGLHPNALTHAEAAECVATVSGNDAFWKFGDSLFANQPTDPSRYGELAQAAGTDTTAFAQCFQNASSTVGAHITADIQNGTAIGANGTPYSVVIATGQVPTVLPGAFSYADVKDAVTQMLSKVGN